MPIVWLGACGAQTDLMPEEIRKDMPCSRIGPGTIIPIRCLNSYEIGDGSKIDKYYEKVMLVLRNFDIGTF